MQKMDTRQALGNNAGRLQLEIASQTAIDAVAAYLLADMENRTALTSAATSNSLFPSIVVDDYTTALAATAEAVRVRLTLMIKARRQEYNARLPVNRLPIELLAMIIQLVVDCHQPALRLRQLPTLARVAADWNTVVGATPSLWATVCKSYSAKALGESLSKSKQSLLTVDSANTHSARRCTDQEFLTLIKPHIYRWHTVDISVDATRLPSEYSTTPAPNLRFLSVYSHDSARSDTPYDIFSGSAEGLQDLRLTNFLIPWDSALLKGLRTLHLNRIRGSTSPLTSHTILKILSACPELKDLLLGDIDLVMSDEPVHPVAIQLPQLRSLLISIRPPSFPNFLFSRISAPYLVSIWLSRSRGSRNDGTSDTTLISANVISGSAGHLRTFATTGYQIPWAPGLLKGLRSLEIKEVSHGAPTADQLLAVVLENPLLEVLRLLSLKVLPQTTPYGIKDVIILSELKDMTLQTIPSTFAHWLVSVTAAPQLSDLMLYIKLEEGEPSASTLLSPQNLSGHHAVPFVASIRAACRQCPNMRISMESNGDVNLEVEGSPFEFWISIQESAHVAALEWFGQFLDLAGVGEIPVRFSSEFETSVADLVQTVAKVLPQASEFNASGPGISDVLAFLATPSGESEGDSIRWPLPKLTNFTTVSEISLPDVLDMARSRAGLFTGAQLGVELPAAFQQLMFYWQSQDIEENYWKDIEAVVGPNVLCWERQDEY